MNCNIFVFLVSCDTSTALQFHKLNCLIGDNQVCFFLKAKAVPVFSVLKGRVCLFPLHLWEECRDTSRQIIFCLYQLYPSILNCIFFRCVSDELLCSIGVLSLAPIPFVELHPFLMFSWCDGRPCLPALFTSIGGDGKRVWILSLCPS